MKNIIMDFFRNSLVKNIPKNRIGQILQNLTAQKFKL